MATAEELTTIARQLHIAGLAPQREGMLAAEVLHPGAVGGLVSALATLVGEVVTATVEWCAAGPDNTASDSIVPLDPMSPAAAPRSISGSVLASVREAVASASSSTRIGPLGGVRIPDLDTIEELRCMPLGTGPRLDAVVVPRLVPGTGAGAAESERHWVKAKVTLSTPTAESETVELPALAVPVVRIEVPTVMVAFLRGSFNATRGVVLFTPNDMTETEKIAFKNTLYETVQRAAAVLSPMQFLVSMVESRVTSLPALAHVKDLLRAFEAVGIALSPNVALGIAFVDGNTCSNLNDVNVSRGTVNNIEAGDELCSLILLNAATEGPRHWRAWVHDSFEGANLTVRTAGVPVTLIPELPNRDMFIDAKGDLTDFSFPPDRITANDVPPIPPEPFDSSPFLTGPSFRNTFSSSRWEEVLP